MAAASPAPSVPTAPAHSVSQQSVHPVQQPPEILTLGRHTNAWSRQPLHFTMADIEPSLRSRAEAYFRTHASSTHLTLVEFTDALTQLGAKREYCTQFFKAFDLSNSGVVDLEEFVFGIVAMDNETCVAGPFLQLSARTQRCRNK